MVKILFRMQFYELWRVVLQRTSKKESYYYRIRTFICFVRFKIFLHFPNSKLAWGFYWAPHTSVEILQHLPGMSSRDSSSSLAFSLLEYHDEEQMDGKMKRTCTTNIRAFGTKRMLRVFFCRYFMVMRGPDFFVDIYDRVRISTNSEL